MPTDKTPRAIGETLEFTTPKGERLSGEVEGRDWYGETVEFYTVRVENGARYHVSARTLQSGHWF